MAKGQMRSNKETKKPKQEKPKATATATTFSGKLESAERGKAPKK